MIQDTISYAKIDLISYPKLNSTLKLKYNMYSILNVFFNKKTAQIDRFSWPNALLAIALLTDFTDNGNSGSLLAVKKYIDKWIAKGSKIYSLDNALNGLIALHLWEITGNASYKSLSDKVFFYLIEHEKDINGSLPYRNGDTNLNLIDTIGIVCPFLMKYFSVFKNSEAEKLCMNQIQNFSTYGLDTLTSLPYHGYNSKTKTKQGIVGWGRGIGWMLIGLIDTLGNMEEEQNHTETLKSLFCEIVDVTCQYQREDGYFSWQVTSVEGEKDTSATSMILYSISKGVELGYLQKVKFSNILSKGMLALENSTKDGHVFDCSSECRGLGQYPQYYSTYPWSNGPSIMFCLSLSRLMRICDGK